MDLITNIETELKNVLLEIDSYATSASAYPYYNTVTVVNIDDEAVAVEYGQYPTIAIYLNPNETVLSGEQRAYRNELSFQLVCSVALSEEVDSPRFAINQKMNEILSDIKAVLSKNYNLNCSCDLCEILRSTRVYNTNGDTFRAGDIIIDLKVSYMQSRLNPNLKCHG